MESKFLFLNNNQLNVSFLLWLNKPREEKLRWLYSGYWAILLKSRYTPMITSQNSIRNVSVATDEGPSPKLALSEGGSRG